MEYTLKHHAGITGLVATALWVWAVVNSVKAGMFSDFGTVSFLVVMVANALLYRHVSNSETQQVPKNISNFVNAAGILVVLNYCGGVILGLGFIEPFCSGEFLPVEATEAACSTSFAIYCGIAAALWLVWTILGWRWMKTYSAAKDLDEPAKDPSDTEELQPDEGSAAINV